MVELELVWTPNHLVVGLWGNLQPGTKAMLISCILVLKQRSDFLLVLLNFLILLFFLLSRAKSQIRCLPLHDCSWSGVGVTGQIKVDHPTTLTSLDGFLQLLQRAISAIFLTFQDKKNLVISQNPYKTQPSSHKFILKKKQKPYPTTPQSSRTTRSRGEWNAHKTPRWFCGAVSKKLSAFCSVSHTPAP